MAEFALVEPPRVPEPAEVAPALEALLMLADEPRPTAELAAAVGAPERVVATALEQLVDFYDETGRGFELRQVAGGWRYWTREEHAELIAASVLAGQSAKLSQAALETLAVVAYLQPVSRGRVAAVRGVNVDGVVRTLLTRGLVAESGHDPESGAVTFTTTAHFLERMGLGSLDELPPLAPLLPEASALEAELGRLAPVPSAPTDADAPDADAPDADASQADRPDADAPQADAPTAAASADGLGAAGDDEAFVGGIRPDTTSSSIDPTSSFDDQDSRDPA